MAQSRSRPCSGAIRSLQWEVRRNVRIALSKYWSDTAAMSMMLRPASKFPQKAEISIKTLKESTTQALIR